VIIKSPVNSCAKRGSTASNYRCPLVDICALRPSHRGRGAGRNQVDAVVNDRWNGKTAAAPAQSIRRASAAANNAAEDYRYSELARRRRNGASAIMTLPPGRPQASLRIIPAQAAATEFLFFSPTWKSRLRTVLLLLRFEQRIKEMVML